MNTIVIAAILVLAAACPQMIGAQEKSCSRNSPVGHDVCLASSESKQVGQASASELLERMRATYATLPSYADTGVVLLEERGIGSTLLTERHRFATRFLAPRGFFLDFQKNAGTERTVIWCQGDLFHTWWSATGVHEQYEPGSGANAFALSALPTAGASLLIPALLFQHATLQSPLLVMTDSQYDGTETLAGILHHKISARVRLNYWSPDTRVTTVWIDADTYLVRKVLEETPSGMGKSVISRVTTSFEPVARPTIGIADLQFTPPD